MPVCLSVWRGVSHFREGLLISGRGFSFQGGAFLHSGRGFKIKSPPFCSLRVDFLKAHTFLHSQLYLNSNSISDFFVVFSSLRSCKFRMQKKTRKTICIFRQKCILSAIKACNIKSIQTPSWLYLDSNSPSDFIF